MPLDLPGFYWDAITNRMFPLSYKPKPPEVTQPTEPTEPTECHPKKSSWRASEQLRTEYVQSTRNRAAHIVMASQIASTSRAHKSDVDPGGTITTFCTTTLFGTRHSFIGDDQGFIYAPPDGEGEDEEMCQAWIPSLAIHSSEITSICISGPLCVATSTGSARKVIVQDLSAARTVDFSIDRLPEIWTSHLLGRSLTLGLFRSAAYVEDIEIRQHFRYFNTHSDVFAVHQPQDVSPSFISGKPRLTIVYLLQNLFFTGTRSGSIIRFDTRLPKSYGDHLFCGSSGSKNERAPIRHLHVIRQWQLIASCANGDLGLFDLRFPRDSDPLMAFSGHVDAIVSHTPRLGLAVDPSENFLFAAGKDCRIRAWSLQTGNKLHPPCQLPSSSSTILPPETQPRSSNDCNPLATVFDHPVPALQITAEQDGSCLWAASGVHLSRYHLGQRGSRINFSP